jgi:4-carboxymuconolactone decarboxylase
MSDGFVPFDPDSLPAEARAVHDRIMRERGYLPGPYLCWLAAPGFTDRIEPVEEHLRHGVSLDARIVVVATLVVARHWRASYVWTSYAPTAVKAGVDAAAVDTILAGTPPDFTQDDEAVAHAFCAGLMSGGGVDDATWARARETFGEHGLNELLGLLGLYTSVCLTMVAYRMPTKNGEPDPFG